MYRLHAVYVKWSTILWRDADVSSALQSVLCAPDDRILHDISGRVFA